MQGALPQCAVLAVAISPGLAADHRVRGLIRRKIARLLVCCCAGGEKK